VHSPCKQMGCPRREAHTRPLFSTWHHDCTLNYIEQAPAGLPSCLWTVTPRLHTPFHICHRCNGCNTSNCRSNQQCQAMPAAALCSSFLQPLLQLPANCTKQTMLTPKAVTSSASQHLCALQGCVPCSCMPTAQFTVNNQVPAATTCCCAHLADTSSHHHTCHHMLTGAAHRGLTPRDTIQNQHPLPLLFHTILNPVIAAPPPLPSELPPCCSVTTPWTPLQAPLNCDGQGPVCWAVDCHLSVQTHPYQGTHHWCRSPCAAATSSLAMLVIWTPLYNTPKKPRVLYQCWTNAHVAGAVLRQVAAAVS
jgi:hypothetical protein